MATKQVSQQLSAVAGMATSPLSPVAKAAQKHLVGVIKAKSRVERQAAIRKAVAEQARDTRVPQTRPDHGEHIWIYSMRGTNRVIYSLTQEIDNDKALAQITFVGKKSVPSHIRPDMWNPLAIVTFPNAAQGLEAFRMLREFRLRHEYEWRDLLNKINDLPEKRQRIKLLQNQKPNSVADLAATLALQHRLGKEEFERRLTQLQQKEEIYQTTRQQLQDMEVKIAQAEATGEGKNTPAYSELVAQRGKLKAGFAELSRFHVAVDNARKAAVAEADARELASSAGAEDEQSPRDAFIRHRQLELVPKHLGELRNYGPLPKRGIIRQKMIQELVPTRQYIPTLNGVKIIWADGNDRNYAETWPVAVEHATMGEMKGAAPHPDRLRDDAIWRDEAPEIIEAFEGRDQELLGRERIEWSGQSAEADKFLQYLTVRKQQVLQQREKLYSLEKMKQPLGLDEQALVLDTLAAGHAVTAFRKIIRTLSQDDPAAGQEKLKRRRYEEDARKHLAKAAAYQEQAQQIRIEAADQAQLPTQDMRHHLKKLKRNTSDAKARASWSALSLSDKVHSLRTGLSESGIRISLSPKVRSHLARTLLAANQKESNLTPEEEEMLKNVELDGESSGKNEDEVDEAEEQQQSEGENADEKDKQIDLERQERRQQEEKKSLWSRVFSAFSSTGSKDGQPRA